MSSAVSNAVSEIEASIKEVMLGEFKDEGGYFRMETANQTAGEEVDTYVDGLGTRELLELAYDSGILYETPEIDGTIYQMMSSLLNQHLYEKVDLDRIKDEIESECCIFCGEPGEDCTCEDDLNEASAEDECRDSDDGFAGAIVPTGTNGIGGQTYF